MKKILLYLIIGSFVFNSCKSNSDDNSSVKIPIETQNSYDDAAIQKYLLDNYFDAQGKVVAYSATDPADDNIPSLNTYSPTLLPSGVVIVKIPTAQPTPGKTIGDTDVLRLTSISTSVIAYKNDVGVKFGVPKSFRNTINTGVPEVDPSYFYVKNSKLNGKPRSFYEIEGLQEGIKYLKSCEIPDITNYNMQGVILVPSRAAFARDSNALDLNEPTFKVNDASFIFNVQVYKTDTRSASEL